MERVLITGASGFIGRHVVEEASKNKEWELYALTHRRREAGFPEGTHVLTADLGKADDCDEMIGKIRPDIVIHLAWKLNDSSGYRQSGDNLVWTENSLRLLRGAAENGCRRFVFAGTGDQYGHDVGFCREKKGDCRRSLYGAGKQAVENLGIDYCAKKGCKFVSARIFSVYGGEDYRKNPTAIAQAIINFKHGEPFVCRSPNNVWDFIYVTDVARALIKLAQSDYHGAVNVGTGKPSAVRSIFKEIADQMGAQSLLHFTENEEIAMIVADTSILRDDIGFRCEVDVHEGLRRTIAWWTSRPEA